MRSLALVSAVAAAAFSLSLMTLPALADSQGPSASPPAPSSTGKPEDEVVKSLTPERLAGILQDMGYRANVQTFGENKKNKDVATGMAGYKIFIYFFDCDGSYNCTSIQYEAPFEKDPSFTLSRINSYNARKRYSRLYINPDDGSLVLDYDLFIDGMTLGSIKESVTLFDSIMGNFKKFTE